MSERLIQRVACKVVVEAKGGILALYPSEIDRNRKWHIPGGIRDEVEEKLVDTGKREVFEETGIDLSDCTLKTFKHGEWTAVDKGEKVGILAVFMHVILPERPHIVLSDEHVDSAWLDRSNHRNYDANKEVHEIVEELL